MSNSSSARRVRTAAFVAAPLTLLALSLSACSPDHITTMDSPTPKGSHMAKPAKHEDKPTQDTTEATESEAPSKATASADSSEPTAADPTDVPSFLTGEDATYKVKALKTAGERLPTGSFKGVQVNGDPTSSTGTELTMTGLCSGAVYTVKATDDGGYTADESGDADATQCTDPADTKVAQKVDSILNGPITVAVDGTEISLSNDSDMLAVTPAR